MKFTVSHKKGSKFDSGLRGFFQYRDLGINAATEGNYGANVIELFQANIPRANGIYIN